MSRGRRKRLEEKIVRNLTSARSLRELARLSETSLSTVQYVIQRLTKRGEIKWIPRHTFFGLIKVGMVFDIEETFPTLSEEALLNGVAAIYELLGLGRRYLYVSGVFPLKLLDKALRKVERTLNLKLGEKVLTREYIVRYPGIRTLRGDADEQQLKSLLERFRTPLRESEPSRVPDKIDLMLLAGKEAFGPFIRLNEIYRKLGKQAELTSISRQVLSYHYKHHVLPGWLCNTFIEYLPISETPLRLIVLKGRDAAALARALMHIEHSLEANVDRYSALVIAQYPCKLLRKVYELISYASVSQVKMTIMKPLIRRDILKYWKFLGLKCKWILND